MVFCLDISFTFTQLLHGRADRYSFLCVSLHLCSLCLKHPNSLGSLQLVNEIMKTFYQEGNISFWRSHLWYPFCWGITEENIWAYILHRILNVMLLPSQGQSEMRPFFPQGKIALFSVWRDNRNHGVQPSHIMDGESETQLRNLHQAYAASW